MPDCAGRACGPDPRCGTSCGTCAEPTFCNDHEGHCIDIELTCAATGAPIVASPDALGMATNHLGDARWDVAERAGLLSAVGVRYGQLGVTPSREMDPVFLARRDTVLSELGAAGLSPVLILNETNEDGTLDDDEVWAAFLGEWPAFVRRQVLRYGPAGAGVVSDWELLNEPNLLMREISADRYLELLEVTVPEIRALDPAARIWGPTVVFHAGNDGYGDGTGWPESVQTSAAMSYLDRVLELAPAGSLDVVSVHIYQPTPERLVDVQLAIVERMAARGRRDVPLVVNEGQLPGPPTPAGTCPFSTVDPSVTRAQLERRQAHLVAQYYSCLLGASASGAFWFLPDDRYLPTGMPCEPDNVRRYGVVGFAEDPPTSDTWSARPKDGYYVMRRLAQTLEHRRSARARVEAVPSPCRIPAGATECTSRIMWAGRDPAVGALSLWRGDERLGCIEPGAEAGAVDVQLGVDRTRLDVRESATCASAPSGDPLDTTFARGEALAARERAAVFALEEPCRIAPGETGCAVTLGLHSEGLDTSEWSHVALVLGDTVMRCIPANTTTTHRTGAFHGRGGLAYGLYPAREGCGTRGRLLAATRVHGMR